MAAQVTDKWYESMAEAVEAIEQLPRAADDPLGRSSQSGDSDWAGCTFDEAMEMAKWGWQVDRSEIDPEVEAVMEQVADRLNAHLADQFREVYDVSGGFVDVGRYLDGEPECMVEQWVDPDVKRGKVLKLLNMATADAGISEKVLRERGRAVAVAVEVLHQLGFNLEIWTGEAVKQMNGTNHVAVEMVKLKEAEDPLDWDALMFGIGHPGMLRRVIFGLNETRPEDERRRFGFKPKGGYGYPCSLPKEIGEGFDVVLEQQQNNQFNRDAFIEQVMVTAESVRIADVEV